MSFRILVVVLAAAGCVSDAPRPIPPPGQARPVDRLSQLGLFDGAPARQVPRAGVIAYDINAPLYADGATKRRFVYLPPGARVHVTDGYWELPVGAYLIKTFGFPIDARDPARGERLIETRFLVRTADGYTGSTYMWDDAQTDAIVSPGDVDVPVRWIDRDGAPHDQRVHVPGTSQCGSCHQGRALGWRASQLDGQALPLDAPLPPHDTLVDPFGAAPLDARARSYLDATCSHCHGRGGIAEDTGLLWSYANTDAAHRPDCRKTAEVDGRDRVIVPGHPEKSELLARMRSTDSSVVMPRGPTRIPDAAGIALLAAWIAAMPPVTCR